MQTIKFRAWEESAIKGLQMYSWKEIQELSMNAFFIKGDPQGRYKLMQFTGLHDKNLKEIYIGDLVYYGEDEFPYEVLINDFSQIPVIDSDLGQENLCKCHGKVKVVGNIHEGFTE